MKTWSVALVLCLNIGVDPPDVMKTIPCARKECWIGKLFAVSTAPVGRAFGLKYRLADLLQTISRASSRFTRQ